MFFLNDSHFGRHSGFLGKFPKESPGLLVCYSANFSALHCKFQLVVSYFKRTTYVFVEITAILDAILDFLEEPKGFSRTFSVLFCPYFRSYTEHFTLL